jgi:hypothetical protein
MLEVVQQDLRVERNDSEVFHKSVQFLSLFDILEDFAIELMKEMNLI